MIHLLHQIVGRYLFQHRLIALLDVVSVAIGVAVYLAIQTANHSATRAFESSIDLVSGKAQLEIRGAAGAVDETILAIARKHEGVRAATPLVEGYVTLPDHPGRFLHLVGSDPFSNTYFQTVGTRATESEEFDLSAWLARSRQILIHPDMAEALDLETGGEVEAAVNGARIPLSITGMIPPDEAVGRDASTSVAVMDIGWAQELLGMAGELTAIQILIDESAELKEVQESLAAELPDGVLLQAPEQRSLQIQRMLDGFQLNLTALSMVSILVGVFLIYNSVSASVVRRRREIGILRSTGASRGQILGVFLAEGLLLGLPGILLGIPGGILLAQGIIGQVSSTISSHYILMQIAGAFVSPQHLLHAFGYGCAAVLAGALFPAIEAARIPPLHALRPNRSIQSGVKTRRGRSWLTIGGILSLFLAALFSWLSLQTGPAALSFAGCFLLIVGFSALSPRLCRWGASAFRGILEWFDGTWTTLPRIATDQFARSLHRSAVTVAALMTAVSMTIGVNVMVGSFRNTVDSWIQEGMKADLFIAPAANEVIGFQSFLSEDILGFLRESEDVTQLETYREVSISREDGISFSMGVVDEAARNTLSFIGGERERKINAFFEPGKALATEALSRRLNLAEGDTIDVPTPAGTQAFTIAGIYYDYSDDQGKLAITRQNFNRYWQEPGVHSAAIYLVEPEQTDAFVQILRDRFQDTEQLTIYSNRTLRERVFEVFDQTFAITGVLRTIAVIVAMLGVGLALATLVMERTREIATWRALGGSRRQVRIVYLTEAGLLGLISSGIGILCGLGMAMILTWVVNKAFFGWTIQFQIPWLEVLATPLWVVPAAILAGLIPATRAARAPVAAALRVD